MVADHQRAAAITRAGHAAFGTCSGHAEAHFGPLRQFTITNAHHADHTVQTRALHACLCAGADGSSRPQPEQTQEGAWWQCKLGRSALRALAHSVRASCGSVSGRKIPHVLESWLHVLPENQVRHAAWQGGQLCPVSHGFGTGEAIGQMDDSVGVDEAVSVLCPVLTPVPSREVHRPYQPEFLTQRRIGLSLAVSGTAPWSLLPPVYRSEAVCRVRPPTSPWCSDSSSPPSLRHSARRLLPICRPSVRALPRPRHPARPFGVREGCLGRNEHNPEHPDQDRPNGVLPVLQL